ncbi:MG2 domain-containing protein [Singulisphaera sp. Ch08]|uniref:MG2 domain-containing protein n=1 Tax=Singulisphaera sp. Ch08 TaxID=3120278 RepID=A0AAU7CJH8_9BACT
MDGSHEHVVDLLIGYRDRTLAPVEAARVEGHCARCHDCRTALETVQAGGRTAEPPARIGPGGWFFRIFWATAAVTGLALLAAHTYLGSLEPTPYDLRVLGQSEWLPGSKAALHLRVLRPTGKGGVPGVSLTLDLDGPNPGRTVRLAEVTTGADGSAHARFRLPDWADGTYPLQVRARPAGTTASESLTQPVRLRRSWRLMLSTDKPVYQPGQTIRVRALSLRRPDLKAVAGQPLSFSVSDSKGNVVFRSRGSTSAHGIGSAECPLAVELIEGPYRVECRVGSVSSTTTVEVKTYVLPRFKVAVEFDRPFYQPGQVVKGKVQARYVFGKPVAGGAVTVEAATPGNLARPLEVAASPTTRDDGTSEFSLSLPEALFGRPQDSGDVPVTFTATVKDTAGQSQSRAARLTVASSPIRIELVPEAGALVRGISNTLHVFTGYPDGRPAQTRLSIRGIGDDVATDARGVASFEITPESDRLSFQVQAKDAQGLTGHRDLAMEVGKAGDDFLVRTDRAVYRGGQTLTLTAIGAGREPVFIDLIKDGQTMLSESVAVERGRGEFEVDLPAELSGTVLLCAYRYDANGYPVRKTRVLYVRPANELKIETAWDRAEYAPGGRAKLSIALTDDQGRPRPGAVSLAAVDEAVFAVLEQKPGLERTFFTLDEELMKPVYEVHSWSPDDPADDPRFESALFARTARVVDPVAALGGLGADAEELGPMLRRVLTRPDWEVLARQVGMSNDMVERLRGGGGPHSLALSTYPEKLARVARTQRIGSEWIGIATAILVVAALAVSVIWGLIHIRDFAGWLVLAGALVVLIALLLPAVNAAREAGRRAQTLNDLRQLELASAPGAAESAGGGVAVRVRQFFPETLLWRPELVTDDQGRASLELDLADSITTWRLNASAVTRDGRLGASQSPLRVFQPFFVDLDLPPALTRGDEVAVPVVVSNYLDRPQSVVVTLREASWFERREGASKTLALKPGEVRSVHFRLMVKDVGRQELEVTAKGEGAADAVRRPIEVVPDGRRVERVESGTLRPSATFAFETPEGAIPGSIAAFVKVYPSSFSQLVEGLDAIFQRPYGCFEQTSSTTYPNVLALDYLKRTGKSLPAVEAKARQYIHLGYQRLLSFEIAGGGFDWFGQPPANRVLTAYGLMEFQDMARVHDVDGALIERTRRWLLAQQDADGTWAPEAHRLHDDPTAGQGDDRLARLSTTAYIAWAAFSGRPDDPQARATRTFLTDQRPEAIDDPYTLALVANALLAIDPQSGVARPYLDRLRALKHDSDDGRLSWWEPPASRRTVFYGAGAAGGVETTATAILALLADGGEPATTRAALGWLAGRKDRHGTWGSTQATVLALKALLAGTGKALGGDRERRLTIALDDELIRELVVSADQADVVQQVDLSDRVARGSHRLTLTDRSEAESAYQVVSRYHVADDRNDQADEGPLAIGLDYDRAALTVDDVVTVKATVENRGPKVAPMVVLDLPIPGGFTLERDDLDRLVAAGGVARYQVTPRSAIIYLRGLAPGRPLVLSYRLRALMPVRVTVPSARAYEYYAPDRRGSSRPGQLSVAPRPSDPAGQPDEFGER